MKRLLIASLLCLVACAKGTENYTPVPFSFANRPPVKMRVAEIRLVPAYQPPMVPPFAEHRFPTPPAKAAEQWVRDRMTAVGTQGVLEVTIEDAAVREVELPKKTGIEGWFTDDQDTRYDAQLTVTMRLYDGLSGLSVANGNITVTRARTVHEKASVAEREHAFDTLVGEMMAQFDAEAQMRLNQFFSAYLVR